MKRLKKNLVLILRWLIAFFFFFFFFFFRKNHTNIYLAAVDL